MYLICLALCRQRKTVSQFFQYASSHCIVSRSTTVRAAYSYVHGSMHNLRRDNRFILEVLEDYPRLYGRKRQRMDEPTSRPPMGIKVSCIHVLTRRSELSPKGFSRLKGSQMALVEARRTHKARLLGQYPRVAPGVGPWELLLRAIVFRPLFLRNHKDFQAWWLLIREQSREPRYWLRCA